MAWTGLALTVDGRSALNEAQLSGHMQIKAIVVGDGAPPANFGTQKGLVHQLYEITEIHVDKTESGCTVTADFPKVDYDYYFREIGILIDTDQGDKLYVYDNCGDDAQYIVSTTGVETTRKRIRLSLVIADVPEITVSNPSLVYVAYDDFEATVESLEQTIEENDTKQQEALDAAKDLVMDIINEHLSDKNNPHGIDQDQVGLDQVDNTADMDKPVSTAQQAALDDLYQQLTAYTQQKIADLINGAPTSLDTLKEVSDAIAAHKEIMDALDAAIGKKASAAEFDSHVKNTAMHTNTWRGIQNNLTSDSATDSLSAAQGKKLKGMVDELNTGLGEKSNSGHTHDDRYYTESEIDAKLSEKAATSHTHNYAGSAAAGGSATSASKLDSSAGSASQPVYFSEGKPKACTHTLGKTVPTDAVFTDTQYTTGTGLAAIPGIVDPTNPNKMTYVLVNTGLLNEILQTYNGAGSNRNTVLTFAYGNSGGETKYIGVTVGCLSKYGGTVNGSIYMTKGNMFKLGDTACLANNSDNYSNWQFDNGTGIAISSGVDIWRALRPQTDNDMTLGTTSQRWQAVFAGSSAISTSDRNLKKDITPISDKYLEFFTLLQPVSYRFIDGTSGRIHIGFISQDVESAMQQVGLTDLDFAGFCKDIAQREIRTPRKEQVIDADGEPILDDEGNPTYREYEDITYEDVLDADGNPVYVYSLRYEEFIALNTAVIQHQQRKLLALEKRVEALDGIQS